MSKHTNVPMQQRWERPLDVALGHWKQQLPTRYLDLAGRGDLNALSHLLTEYPEFLNKRGNHNRTLLWEATRRGKLATVKWLVERGAEVDATGCYNNESYVQITPYCAAVYYHKPEIAAYLHSQGANLDIFRAAFLGEQSQVADALITNPDLLQAEDPCDQIYFVPLLAFSVAGGQAALVEFLLQRGAVVTPYSAQLLHLAARASRMDLVKLLVKNGAQVSAVDSGIFVAISDMDIIQYLLNHGASTTQPGKNGFPALIYVARGDKGEHPEKVQLLLEHGASVNAIGPNGRTALHYAAAAGYTKVITILFEHGADPGLKDQQGRTALNLAQAAGKTKAAILLVQR